MYADTCAVHKQKRLQLRLQISSPRLSSKTLACLLLKVATWRPNTLLVCTQTCVRCLCFMKQHAHYLSLIQLTEQQSADLHVGCPPSAGRSYGLMLCAADPAGISAVPSEAVPIPDAPALGSSEQPTLPDGSSPPLTAAMAVGAHAFRDSWSLY